MQRSMLERQKKFCRTIMKEYAKTHGGEKARADVIVVDPPRKGCDETLLETIVKMEPEKVVYVSCDSATLAKGSGSICVKMGMRSGKCGEWISSRRRCMSRR